MKKAAEILGRAVLFALLFLPWFWALNTPLSNPINILVIVGGVLLVFPLVWLGRKFLDRQLLAKDAAWVTTWVHFSVMVLFGMAIIRAVSTQGSWSGWVIPVPTGFSLALVIVTGAAVLLSVINLALKGWGAPFAIALSQKVASDWMYAWTRNPMVLATLAFLTSLGIWFQSLYFELWVLILFTPALLFFVKVYEERELELRFGAPYLEYKSRTPMLFPRKPKP
jgi:protein-S-isoprenylcysteine O-methyltransferase Ste14